ncbi:MAG TPA: alpha-L-rhamnosidase C-terminal domain-containing protein [Steroidobacteraceae bacterium]|nr:alpha-L-rhamnosidase C-terminal domain-containing protein [Steroidobacteraceae bacterium]
MRALQTLAVITATLAGIASPSPGAAATSPADGWITHPAARTQTPVVLHFRRVFELAKAASTLPIEVTADNRFILFVNGKRVASGPSTGTVEHWRYARLDIAPQVHAGRNVIAAVVWNFGEAAPLAQQSVATGFRLVGEPVSTAAGGWRVKIDAGHRASPGREQLPWQYYAAGAAETIDARLADWDWRGERESGGGWQEAVPAPQAAVRELVEDRLPPQRWRAVPPGRVVRVVPARAQDFPRRPLTIPANSHIKLLLQRQAMVSAYPELEVSGGAGATIRMTWSEALYDADRKKGDRDLVGDRRILGLTDTFLPDGPLRRFAPLWWRTFRYAEIDVTTAAEPLTLRALRLHETGYPFDTVARFQSSDPALDDIWSIGWRTLQVDAHETFMDSSFWEQLQYAGDTRIEMLISYAVSGDSRLAEQAIDAFAASRADGGLVQGRWPTRDPVVIATFSFAWVGMLADWRMQQPDTRVITRHLPRMREVLRWFEPWRNAAGLLGKNPQWNFIDWAGQRWDDRDTFPSWGRDNGSCLMTAMWVGALRQGAALESALGDAAQAQWDTARADEARRAIREHCWAAGRGLFADDADRQVFSQHMNVFAVLYDIATAEESRAILERITVPGRGIDAPAGMYTSTYYFAWYLVRAFAHAGLASRYPRLLESWRALLALHYTTWPESRGDTRSDTHAWSAHPTADLLGIVAGIQPAAPGYARLRVAPTLGDLTSLDATAATPHGPVSVRYRVAGGVLTAEIERPASLPGDFIWQGESHPLTRTHTTLKLPR